MVRRHWEAMETSWKDCMIVIIIININIIIMVYIDNVTGDFNMGQCRRHWGNYRNISGPSWSSLSSSSLWCMLTMWLKNTTPGSVEDIEKLWKHLGVDCMMVIIIIIITITMTLIMVYVDNVTVEYDMGQSRRHWETTETACDGLHNSPPPPSPSLPPPPPHHGVCWQCDRRT